MLTSEGPLNGQSFPFSFVKMFENLYMTAVFGLFLTKWKQEYKVLNVHFSWLGLLIDPIDKIVCVRRMINNII